MVDDRGEEPRRRENLHVLVVDDNRDAADSLCMLLRLWGYDCRAAYDGGTGLEEAVAYRPDCLLLDIAMPRLDGYTLARRVKKQPGLEQTRLVALTAYSDASHLERVREAGFDYHLVKPADPSEIERILKMLSEVVKLAGRTEELARQNVALASEAKQLLEEVKEDIREIKHEVKEIKEELLEVKEGKSEERPAEEGPGAAP
jgi:CheY-like chemotaxis protein